ncbi:hypothetical protein ACU8OQ_25695 (plasmid) [Rhizobium leguminosarum]
MPEALTGALASLATSRDGKLLAAPDEGGNILLWDLQDGKNIGTVQLDGSPVSVVGIDRTNNIIAAISTGEKNIVRLATTPAALIERACELAGRDLNEIEWADLDTGTAFSPTCRVTGASVSRNF